MGLTNSGVQTGTSLAAIELEKLRFSLATDSVEFILREGKAPIAIMPDDRARKGGRRSVSATPSVIQQYLRGVGLDKNHSGAFAVAQASHCQCYRIAVRIVNHHAIGGVRGVVWEISDTGKDRLVELDGVIVALGSRADEVRLRGQSGPRRCER
jgi:hypothetical protein